MIPKSAVKAYLNRPLDDHRWMKSLSDEALDAALGDISPPPTLNACLKRHQKICVYLGIAYPRFGFWLDMGLGKTLLALELLRYWWQTKQFRRAVIFIKSDKAVPTWEKHFRLYNIDLPYVVLTGSSAEKWEQLDKFGDGLIIVPYPGAVAMVSDETVSGKSNKTKWIISRDKFARFADRVGAMVMDESTCVGNYSSLTHGLCWKLAQQVSICYALAGRPFGRDPTMLWSQHSVIDGGETMGETLGLFREAFFSSADNWFARKHSRFSKTFTFRKSMTKQLSRMARHRSLSYDEEECLDVPPLVPVIEEVRLPGEASAYYTRMVEEIVAARGNLTEMKNIFCRMRQLSSGFLGFKDDETGMRAQIAFDENPKLDRLMELLGELPLNRKCVVFYEFTWSGRGIMERLEAQNQKGVWLWSGTKNSAGELRRFIEDPSVTVLVSQHRVGGYSVDGLQDVANYTMFYESPVSVIDREQAECRVRRQGQLHKVFQYDLVARGTMDQRILDFHREGEDLLTALRADPEKVMRNGACF